MIPGKPGIFYFYPMRYIITHLLLLLTLCSARNAAAQSSASFPKSWEGDWKGELRWYKTGSTEPQTVNMELRIHPGDSINTWSWQIIYGSASEDNRPYRLIMKDSAGIHWVIDELNGIVLDQYWVGSKFSGSFTVMKSTIVNSYWMEGDQLFIEFLSLGAKPLTTTGYGTEESPSVDSYRVTGYQKAILKRSK